MRADWDISCCKHLLRFLSGKFNVFLHFATQWCADVYHLGAAKLLCTKRIQIITYSLPYCRIIRSRRPECVPLRFSTVFPDIRRYAIREVGVTRHLFFAEYIPQTDAQPVYNTVRAV